MFKVEAKSRPEGNYRTAGRCVQGHTSYKKDGDNSSAYKCPNCGHDVR